MSRSQQRTGRKNAHHSEFHSDAFKDNDLAWKELHYFLKALEIIRGDAPAKVLLCGTGGMQSETLCGIRLQWRECVYVIFALDLRDFHDRS